MNQRIAETRELVQPTFTEVIARGENLAEGYEAYHLSSTELSRLRGLESEAYSAYEKSEVYDRYANPGCFGTPRVIGYDKDLKTAFNQARKEAQAQADIWHDRRDRMFDVVLQEPKLNGLEKVALVGSLFGDKIPEQTEEEQFTATYSGLKAINNQLQAGEAVALFNNRDDYFVKIDQGEQGLSADISQSSITLSTAAARGLRVFPSSNLGSGYSIGPWVSEKGLELLKLQKIDGARDLNVLGRLFSSNNQWLYMGSITNLDAGQGKGRAVARMVAAQQTGMAITEVNDFDEAAREKIESDLLKAIYQRVGNAVVRDQTGRGEYSNMYGKPNLQLVHEDALTLGALAKCLQLTPLAVRDSIEQHLAAVHEKILDGKLPASEMNYLKVAELRTDRFIAEMFPAA